MAETIFSGGPWGTLAVDNEVVFQNDSLRLRKLWTWEGVKITWQPFTKDILTIESAEMHGRNFYTLMRTYGPKVSSEVFSLVGTYFNGLLPVAVAGKGWGYLDENGQLVVPMKYDYLKEFDGTRGLAYYRDGRVVLVDGQGREYPLPGNRPGREYQTITHFEEGMAAVDIGTPDTWVEGEDEPELKAGIWGYINDRGEEVIAPQFVYAEGFEGGFALAARGMWCTRTNEQGQTVPVWSMTKWGAVDKKGRDIVPFQFDALLRFRGRSDVLSAHYGGWKKGEAGMVDLRGNWLAGSSVYPGFCGFLPDSRGDLFSFCANARCNGKLLAGVYDLRQNKVLFEPQFLSVEFLEGGELLVEVFDEKLDRSAWKVIDRQGGEREPVPSDYLHRAGDDGQGESGPPLIAAPSRGRQGKYGAVTHDGTAALPARYDEMTWCGERWLLCRSGGVYEMYQAEPPTGQPL